MHGPPRGRAPLLGILGVVIVLGLVPSLLAAAPIDPWPWPQADAAEDAGPADTEGAARHEPQAEEEADGDGGPPPTAAFAVIDEVTLHLPASDVVLVGFHEASSSEALAFLPRGQLRDHQNTTKFDPPEDAADGPDYVVLSSRGRPYPATSAIDVLLDGSLPVRSPVSGTVTEVRGYHLYGRYADQRLEIAPAVAPHQRIVMIHLDGVVVAVGEEVVAGETVLAGGARPFPFGSHIDRYTEPDRHPHVHYEIKRAVPEGDETTEDGSDQG
jgi:hypothetical protein